MQLRHNKSSWVRLVVLAWTAVWMLAAPLVHIHPEADHHHGEVGHVHGGMVHTVFSPDLLCEFSTYDHASVAATESRCPLHLIAQPLHGAEHPEIDLILASSTKPQVGKGTALDVAAHFFYANRFLRTPAPWQAGPGRSPADRFRSSNLTSRAPPFV